ncbi:sugar ABC transporter substrate-binding protein [Pimelobacter simplex]|uniref:sugar ABC transporter substrate-binding protein n=1 Tax=Nocardioides simplex TaxID=2045 RepID=UPI0019331A9E|nr:substrate-binding domain-containing protein [Pimelobacter simplex]
MAAAKQLIDPYVGKPSEFPIDEPLAGPLPAGTTFAYLQCPIPTCALMAEVVTGAAGMLGVELNAVPASSSAESMQSAMNSIIEMEPDAVLLPPIEASIISKQLATLKNAGVPVVSLGMSDAAKYGITAGVAGRGSNELAGRLLAGWVVNKHGADTHAVYYGTPELTFSPIMQEAFEKELKALCSGCESRAVDLSITTLGTTAPSAVVSDLQSHPDTSVAVFAASEATSGLPAALRTADIGVDTLVFAPSPAALADIQGGGITAGLGVDFPVAEFLTVDAAARLVLEQPLGSNQSGDEGGIAPFQFLEKADITFDPSKGWTGYPDFAERFGALWGVS